MVPLNNSTYASYTYWYIVFPRLTQIPGTNWCHILVVKRLSCTMTLLSSTPSTPSNNKRKREPCIVPSTLLSQQTPFVNMRVEILDTEHLWSPGYLVQVHPATNNVTIAFDGWGRQWDEQLNWGDPRLATLYTYTKQAKCMVELLPSKKSITNLWPCVVQCRMPHPESPQQGEQGLRQEKKLFCQPYCPQLLPPLVQATLQEDHGGWYPVGKIRLWKDTPDTLPEPLPDGFWSAQETAQRDTTVMPLPLHAFEKGTTLLHHHLRVLKMDGATVKDGRMVDYTINPPTTGVSTASSTSSTTRPMEQHSPPTMVQICPIPVPPLYCAPPTLPPTISLSGPLYPGITQWGKEWIASVTINGNSMFLGSFATQTQAYQATLLATATEGNPSSIPPPATTIPPPADVEPNLIKAKAMDILSIPMENIIMAFEKQHDPSIHSFSLHKWTLEKVSHYCYLKDKEQFEGTETSTVITNQDINRHNSDGTNK